MCRFYEIKPILRCSDEQDVWDDEQENDGYGEEPYDDEEYEREWCD